MAFICTRCALRLQKSSQSVGRTTATRFFSASASGQQSHGVPKFAVSSDPELDQALTEMRNHHIIPAYLPKRERRIITHSAHKQNLEDFPQTIRIGDEDIPLTWRNKLNEIASRKSSINNILNLMREGKKSDWDNLPSLLEGTKKSVEVAGSSAKYKIDYAKIVRLALLADSMGVIMRCLGQAEKTGMTLADDGVLREILWGLRTMAQDSEWSEEATQRALGYATRIAALLEKDQHRASAYSNQTNAKDGRLRPEVMGAFLELVAVQAHQHLDGKDVDGSVRAYAERLLSSKVELETPSSEPARVGPQIEMQRSLSIYHGLLLAQKILGADMPHPDVAKQVLERYQTALAAFASALEARNPQPSSYDNAALTAWNSCIRD